MKTIIISTLSLLLNVIANDAVAQNPSINGQSKLLANELSNCPQSTQLIQQQIITDAVKKSLLYMREEEKLARDVYQVLDRQWHTKVFGNIQPSEQQHMDQIKVFLDAYQLTDSARTEEGLFNDAKLQTLYNQLVAQGLQSSLDAYKVGALIEEVDIHDLQTAIAETEIPEIKAMYTLLMNGS